MLTMVCTQVCNFVSTNRKEVANMKRIFIVGAKRTPIGKFGGSLSTFSASELGAKVISAVLKQSKLPKEKIDQILIGMDRFFVSRFRTSINGNWTRNCCKEIVDSAKNGYN